MNIYFLKEKVLGWKIGKANDVMTRVKSLSNFDFDLDNSFSISIDNIQDSFKIEKNYHNFLHKYRIDRAVVKSYLLENGNHNLDGYTEFFSDDGVKPLILNLLNSPASNLKKINKNVKQQLEYIEPTDNFITVVNNPCIVHPLYNNTMNKVIYNNYSSNQPARIVLTGNKKYLNFDYNFTSSDTNIFNIINNCIKFKWSEHDNTLSILSSLDDLEHTMNIEGFCKLYNTFKL